MARFRCCFVVEADSLEDLEEQYVEYKIDPDWEDLRVEEIIHDKDAKVVSLFTVK